MPSKHHRLGTRKTHNTGGGNDGAALLQPIAGGEMALPIFFLFFFFASLIIIFLFVSQENGEKMGVVVFGRDPKSGVVEVEVAVATATLSCSSLFFYSPQSLCISLILLVFLSI